MAGGIAGSVVFVIILVLLVWMICVRANRTRRGGAGNAEKILNAAAEQNGSQVRGKLIGFFQCPALIV